MWFLHVRIAVGGLDAQSPNMNRTIDPEVLL